MGKRGRERGGETGKERRKGGIETDRERRKTEGERNEERESGEGGANWGIEFFSIQKQMVNRRSNRNYLFWI